MSYTLQRVDDILQFIRDFTVDIEGVGNVCRLASKELFDLSRKKKKKHFIIFWLIPLAALVLLTLRTMGMLSMVHLVMYLVRTEALRGKWRSHS